MKRLTILVVPLSAVGHVNACVGTTLPLLKRGHRVVFFLDETYRGKVKDKGFEEYIFTLETQKNEEHGPNPAKALAEQLLEYKIIGPSSPKEKLESINKYMDSDSNCEVILQTNKFFKKAVEKIKPDCFVVDFGYLPPEIFVTKKPWVYLVSSAPLYYLDDEDAPPAGLGK